jgi:hypothetical protein
MKLRLALLLLSLCFLLLPTFALAQESTETPAPEVTPVPTPADPFPEVPPEDAVGVTLLNAFIAIAAAMLSAPITTSIVSVLKRIPPLSKVSGEILKYTVAAILVSLVLVARRYGFDSELSAGFDFLNTAIISILTLVTSIKSNEAVYSQAVKKDWPVLGYKRT